MFIQANAEYTREEPVCKENFVHGFVFHGQRGVAEYTGSSVFFKTPNSSYTGLKKITPTPEDLKLAMFRMSSRGIAKALK